MTTHAQYEAIREQLLLLLDEYLSTGLGRLPVALLLPIAEDAGDEAVVVLRALGHARSAEHSPQDHHWLRRELEQQLLNASHPQVLGYASQLLAAERRRLPRR